MKPAFTLLAGLAIAMAFVPGSAMYIARQVSQRRRVNGNSTCYRALRPF